MENTEKIIKDMWNIVERKNIHVIEVPGKDKMESSTEIMAKNFPKQKKN